MAVNVAVGHISPYQLFKARASERSSLIALVSGLAGVGVVFVGTREPGMLSVLAPVLILAGLVLIVFCLRDWVFGVKAILVVVILEGAIRKWFLPSASEMVYFYKDILMFVTLFGYYRKTKKTPFVIKRRVRLLVVTLGVFLLFVILSMGFATGIHPLIGILGIKAYCLYVPLAFISVRAFPDKESLIRFLRWYLIVVLPVAAIGMLQFLDNNRSSNLNRYAVSDKLINSNVAIFSDSAGVDYVRITGTFSYVTGLSVFLPIMFALLLALTSLYSKRGLKRGSKVLYYSALGSTVVTAFMTGSRTAVLWMLISVIIFYVFTSGRQAIRRMQQIAIVTVVLFAAFTNIFPQAYDAFYNRTFGGAERVSEGWSRIVDSISFPFTEVSYAGLFGYGVGLTQNGVPALMKRLEIEDQANPIPIGYEAEPGRVALELGAIGFVLYTLLRLVLLTIIFRMALAMRDTESRILAFSATAALVPPLIIGGAVANHTQNVYQWFLVGIVFALYNSEQLSLRNRKKSAPIFEFVRFNGGPRPAAESNYQ